ncbi:MAG: hypothetical protein IK090_00995, partial [Clostridia bacterium]|nr:hypothetical protein [Clostridia bacterium]
DAGTARKSPEDREEITDPIRKPRGAIPPRGFFASGAPFAGVLLLTVGRECGKLYGKKRGAPGGASVKE